MNNPRIIVPLDVPDRESALALASRLDPGHCRVKVGKELFTASGPGLVETLMRDGFQVFLDLKYHDIPNTVAGACRAAAELGVWMLNVHAAGGSRMLRGARAAVGRAAGRPLLIGVTVLTSMTAEDLVETGIDAHPEQQVLRLARLCHASDLDGVVCSPLEVSLLRAHLPPDFILVTPGIRPAGYAADDQRRIMTAGEAIAAGSDYLVIGRPITGAGDPLQALLRIEEEIAMAIPGA